MFAGYVDLHGAVCVSKPDSHLSGAERDRPSRTNGVMLSTCCRVVFCSVVCALTQVAHKVEEPHGRCLNRLPLEWSALRSFIGGHGRLRGNIGINVYKDVVTLPFKPLQPKM